MYLFVTGMNFTFVFTIFLLVFRIVLTVELFFFFFLLVIVLLDIDKEVLVILEDKLRVNSKYELKVSVNRLGEEEKEDLTISLYTKVSPYGGSCTVSNRSGKTKPYRTLLNYLAFQPFNFERTW